MIGYFGFDPNDCLIGEMSTTINLNIKNYKKEDVSSIMLSWIPTKTGTSQKKASALLSQTELIEKYVKKVPIVIFDRYSSMTSDEYQYLRKYNV